LLCRSAVNIQRREGGQLAALREGDLFRFRFRVPGGANADVMFVFAGSAIAVPSSTGTLVSFRLYDGANRLCEDAAGQTNVAYFKSPESLFGLRDSAYEHNGPEGVAASVADFRSIVDGTIEGRIELFVTHPLIVPAVFLPVACGCVFELRPVSRDPRRAPAACIAGQRVCDNHATTMGRNKGICTLCGKGGKLTFEHVPAEASGNQRGVTMYNLEEWLARETATGEMTGGVIRPEGMGLIALCKKCNTDLLGAHYVTAFVKFVEAGKDMLAGVAPRVEELNQRDRATTADAIFLSVNRLAAVKRIVSMLLITSGRGAVTKNPELAEFVMNPTARGYRRGTGSSLL
jgi:hypothetical protein